MEKLLAYHLGRMSVYVEAQAQGVSDLGFVSTGASGCVLVGLGVLVGIKRAQGLPFGGPC